MLSDETSCAPSASGDSLDAGVGRPAKATARKTETDACFSCNESIYAEADDPKLMPIKVVATLTTAAAEASTAVK